MNTDDLPAHAANDREFNSCTFVQFVSLDPEPAQVLLLLSFVFGRLALLELLLPFLFAHDLQFIARNPNAAAQIIFCKLFEHLN